MTTHEDTPLDLDRLQKYSNDTENDFLLWTDEPASMGHHGFEDRDHYETKDGYRLVPEEVAYQAPALLALARGQRSDLAELEKDKARLNKAWMSSFAQALENGGAAHKLAADLAEAREVLQLIGAVDPTVMDDLEAAEPENAGLRYRIAALLPRGDAKGEIDRLLELDGDELKAAIHETGEDYEDLARRGRAAGERTLAAPRGEGGAL